MPKKYTSYDNFLTPKDKADGVIAKGICAISKTLPSVKNNDKVTIVPPKLIIKRYVSWGLLTNLLRNDWTLERIIRELTAITKQLKEEWGAAGEFRFESRKDEDGRMHYDIYMISLETEEEYDKRALQEEKVLAQYRKEYSKVF
jgi:hypothetical protein